MEYSRIHTVSHTAVTVYGTVGSPSPSSSSLTRLVADAIFKINKINLNLSMLSEGLYSV